MSAATLEVCVVLGAWLAVIALLAVFFVDVLGFAI